MTHSFETDHITRWATAARQQVSADYREARYAWDMWPCMATWNLLRKAVEDMQRVKAVTFPVVWGAPDPMRVSGEVRVDYRERFLDLDLGRAEPNVMLSMSGAHYLLQAKIAEELQAKLLAALQAEGVKMIGDEIIIEHGTEGAAKWDRAMKRLRGDKT